jgi:hypothetical protein
VTTALERQEAERLERRIAKRLREALNIIKPKKHPDACERAVAAAIRDIAATKLRLNLQTIAGQMRAVERELAKVSERLARDLRELRARVEVLDDNLPPDDIIGSRSDPPDGAELFPQQKKRTTRAAKQKMMATVLADAVIGNFADPVDSRTNSRTARLASLFYDVANDIPLEKRKALILKHQVRKYYSEVYPKPIEKKPVKKKSQRP